jgi:radical SAM superfamily enzyme YgiQ (UPF0313 family)
VLFASPYPSFSLAAAIFSAAFRPFYPGPDSLRFLVRDYSRFFSTVDLCFIRDLLLLQPQLIGFSCFFWNLDQNLRIASLAKALHPSVFIVFGGPHVGLTRDAVKLMEENRAVDAIACGEADLRFPELAYRVLSGLPIEGLGGLVFRRNGDLLVQDGPACISDPKDIPLVFNDQNEYVTTGLSRYDVVPLQTLRGCRNRCAYCLYPSNGLRPFPLDRVEKEVAFLCGRGIRHVRVCDSHFGGTRDRAMALFDIISGVNTETAFYVYPDPAHLDREYLERARRANCHCISLGVQTLDPVVSAAVNRSTDSDGLQALLSLFREHGHTPQIDMMLGLPDQTAKSLAADLAELRLKNAGEILFSPLMLYPGTDLAEGELTRRMRRMMTFQGYSFSASIGEVGYSRMILSSEAYRLLRLLHRTEWYIRNAVGDDAVYREHMTAWFDTSRGEHADALVETCERLRASSEHVRSQAASLSVRMKRLLQEGMKLSLANMEFIDEVITVDILEAAMRRRNEELRRDIQPAPQASGVIFPEEALGCKWVVQRDVWLQVHAAPPAVLLKDERARKEPSARQSFCLYVCPGAEIAFLSQGEFTFLERFTEPRYIFDDHNPYSTTALDVARKWLNAGVLTRVQTKQ